MSVNTGAKRTDVTDQPLAESHPYSSASSNNSTDWQLVVKSKKLTMWTWIGVFFIMAIHIFMALVVKGSYTGAAVTIIDQWAFVGIGLIFSGACLTGLRPRVRVNSQGVEVRNFLGAQFYPWSVIHGLSFPKGSRTARLELPEFEFVSMWAFMAADGPDVVRAVNKFRVLEDAYLPED